MFTLDHPWLLPALLLLPLLLRLVLPAYRERRVAIAVPNMGRLSALTGSEAGKGAVVLRSTLVQRVLLWITWIGLVVAAARPQLVEEPVLKTVPTRDLLLAVDLSGSMESTDFENSAGEEVDRLTAVKEVLDEFLARREGDRVGLIVFGTAAFVQVPFTEDLDVCRQLLDELQVRMAGPRTAMGDAIGLSISVFERSEVEDRLLIVLTDGNDTGSDVPPDEAARIARDEGIVIHTIAVGDPLAVGEEKLDEEALRRVANTTGGGFFRASDRDELATIYERIDELDVREVETISHRPTRDLFHWPLALAFLLVLVHRALRHLRSALRPAAAAASFLALLTLVSASSPFTGDFHFLRPAWWFALLPLVMIVVAAWQRGRVEGALSKHVDEHLLRALLVGANRRGRLRPGVVLAAGGLVSIVALAGPAWQREPAPFAEDSAAVVIAIEVTPTMLAQDVQPSRLERAAHKVRDLLERRPGARAGLVAFAGSAHTVMPPTADAEIVSTFAAELGPEIMPVEGEATGEAVALSHEMLRTSGAPGSIVLVTDGVPPDQLSALEEQRRSGGAPVHLLAVAGAPDAFVPPGSPSAPALDRTALERAADAAGGSLTVISADDRDVERLAGEVETSFARMAEGGERWRDAGYWLLPVLLLIGLFWFRPGWRIADV